MAKCGLCKKFMPQAEGATCGLSTCKFKTFHKDCVGFTSQAKIGPSWICPKCKSPTPKDNNDA